MAKAREHQGAGLGAVEHGNSVVLITIASGGELLDHRRIDLTCGLPTYPNHHEGSWAVGRYLNSAWSRTISLPDVVALVERVREAAARGARVGLESLATTVGAPISRIAIGVYPELPRTTEERIAYARAATIADSAMYREALASAAAQRGWRVFWYQPGSVFAAATAALGGRDVDALLHSMGRPIGPPWQARKKLAAAAAVAAARTIS